MNRQHTTHERAVWGVDAYRYPSGLILLTLCLGRHRWAVAWNV